MIIKCVCKRPFWGGVKPSSLLLRSLTGLMDQPWMIMNVEKLVELASVPLCLPQIPHDLILA
jgi:hypothetical protein